MKRLIFLATLLFISGCGIGPFANLDHDPYTQKALNLTRKGEVRNNFHTYAILRATHLNPLDNSIKATESFFVGIFIPDDFARGKEGLLNPLYQLTLNGKAPTNITSLDFKRDELVKKMPIAERWFHYYRVDFESQPKTPLNLSYAKQSGESVTLSFPANQK